MLLLNLSGYVEILEHIDIYWTTLIFFYFLIINVWFYDLIAVYLCLACF